MPRLIRSLLRTRSPSLADRTLTLMHALGVMRRDMAHMPRTWLANHYRSERLLWGERAYAQNLAETY